MADATVLSADGRATVSRYAAPECCAASTSPVSASNHTAITQGACRKHRDASPAIPPPVGRRVATLTTATRPRTGVTCFFAYR
ncbi:hypothetical protein GCM10027445_13540 [Amycolatopsis endophytica]